MSRIFGEKLEDMTEEQFFEHTKAWKNKAKGYSRNVRIPTHEDWMMARLLKMIHDEDKLKYIAV